eukprot:gene39087-44313_t
MRLRKTQWERGFAFPALISAHREESKAPPAHACHLRQAQSVAGARFRMRRRCDTDTRPHPAEEMIEPMTSYVLTVSCQSTRGIVAAISGYLAEQGCNIVDSSQFDDLHTGQFFMRVSFISEAGATEAKLEKGFVPVAEKFGMVWNLHDAAKRMKVLLMVSRFGHCLNDLLYRWKIGALPIEIVGVVSNHFDYQKVVVNHDIPFHHIKVTKENKPEAE